MWKLEKKGYSWQLKIFNILINPLQSRHITMKHTHTHTEVVRALMRTGFEFHSG